MIRNLDELLNSLTMYKAVLGGLILLLLSALITSFMGIIPFSPVSLLISLVIITTACFISNLIFAKLFKAQANTESYLISALILFFIMTPPSSLVGLIPLVLVSALAMASKYIFAFKKRHIFNPVAIAAFLITFLGFSASWWIATPVLFPATLITGLLVIRKIRKFSLFIAFTGVVIIEMVIFGILYNVGPITTISQVLLSWPLIFFGAYMLTEPLTTPPTRKLQMLYGGITGFLFAFQLPLGPISLTPELALVIGNIFSYVVSFKQRIILTLKDKQLLSPTIYNFVFSPNEKVDFEAGQYMEWTLPHKNTDIRGNRRFFTIASSLTESDVMLGVRIENDSSSFKNALKNMNIGESMSIGNLKGDFTLPDDEKEKLVFIAGGIGITPFRSIIKYLIDTNEKRDIILIHTCSEREDFVYNDVFGKAEEQMGLKIVHILSDDAKNKNGFKGHIGHFTKDILKEEIPDYKERKFYLSGSNIMVDIYKDILSSAGIKRSNIVTDYFSGY